MIHILLLIVTILITHSNAANIFCIFPMASYSHQQPMLTLSRALAAKGHNLTVITANPSKVPIKNHREIDVSFLYDEFGKMEKRIGIKVERIKAAQFISSAPKIMTYFYDIVLSSDPIQKLIREVNGTNYDLVIYEPMFHGYLIAFADLIGNPPIIGLLSFDPPFGITDEVGNPIIPSYIPDKLLPYGTYMTFWERAYNLYIAVYYYFTLNYVIRPLNEEYVKKYFGNLKYTVKEMEYNKSLLLLSADGATDYSKPYQPNTIFVGPMHINENPEPLPQVIQKWMDEAEDGVIYFSLGGNMKSTGLPEDKRMAFINAFKKFPKIRVLWKWESNEKLPGQPDTVLVQKWLPQQSILAHQKCKLFISQGGLQSFQEAIHFGVPMLAIPIFADQDFNAKKIEVSGAGLGIELYDITFELIHEKLKELLSNSSYKHNMLTLSKLSKDRPMSPVDTAIWWVEYVLRHNGAPHLRPAVLDLTWYQYYMLDILSLVLIVLLAILSIIYFIIKKVIRLLLSLLSTEEKIKKKKKL